MRTLCGTILAAVLSLSANANSVASFCERAQKGDRLTVAFLGGSLSWGANATDPNKTSWRALIGRRRPEAGWPLDAARGGAEDGYAVGEKRQLASGKGQFGMISFRNRSTGTVRIPSTTICWRPL